MRVTGNLKGICTLKARSLAKFTSALSEADTYPDGVGLFLGKALMGFNSRINNMHTWDLIIRCMEKSQKKLCMDPTTHTPMMWAYNWMAVSLTE